MTQFNTSGKFKGYTSHYTPSVDLEGEQALHLVLEVSKVMYEDNPNLIFQSRIFQSADLSSADKLMVLKDLCETHQFSPKTLTAINALSVLKGLGGIQ